MGYREGACWVNCDTSECLAKESTEAVSRWALNFKKMEELQLDKTKEVGSKEKEIVQTEAGER